MTQPGADLPLSFEVNAGQANSDVRFLSRANGYRLFLTPQAAVMVLGSAADPAKPMQSGSTKRPVASPSVLKMKLVGANAQPKITGQDEQVTQSNYFLGSDPGKWRTNVPNYGKVKYEEVYPGVDLVYYGNQRQLEYDFVVSPGTDPGQIKLQFEGARRSSIDSKGDLVLVTKSGVIRQHRPSVYQEVSGVKKEVTSKYHLVGVNQVGIKLGSYDRNRTLFIDPILSYSTYFGGTSSDTGLSIAVDTEHNIYVAGNTFSTDLLMVNAFQPTNNGGDGIGGYWEVFVTKFNPNGTEVVFSTYLGGTKTDVPYGVAVDPSGNVYVAGQTWSSNFPLANAYDQTFGGASGSTDAFVTKLSPTGSSLIYSTYLGGSGNDSNEEGARAIAVDNAGNAYVVGRTWSSVFPVMNAYQSLYAGDSDAFVSKFDAAGALTYSTFLGGSGTDVAEGIAVDSTGNFYVAGQGNSTNFPTVNAFDSTPGNWDGFVCKFNPTGSTLIYSSYFGGNGSDAAKDIAIDDSGHAYLTGYTQSSPASFPLVNAYQQTFGGGPVNFVYDAFVAKVHPSGGSLVYSTYLGGTHYDQGYAIAVDSSGNAYVVGETLSNDFPVANAFQSTRAGSWEGFISKISPTGSTLPFSSYIGGSSAEQMNDLTVDSNDDLYVTGESASTNFPLVAPFQGTLSGASDAVIVKITGLTGYSITGTVTDASGTGMSGVTLTLTGTQSGTKVTGANGTFIFDVPSGGNYTVTPSKAPYVFTPANRTFNNLNGNQIANFTTIVYAISGRVADSQGNGLSEATLTLSGSQTGTTQTDASGNYSFPNCDAGGNYTITASKTSYTFTYAFAPANRNFTNLSANQTAADFTYMTSTQVALNSEADAYVQDGTSANTNFGATTPLLVKSANQADQRRDAYFKFDLSVVSRTIVSAKLRIYAALSVAGSVGTSAYSVADTTWSESAITWANKPVRGSTALNSATITSTNYATYDLDVTSYVVSEKAAGRDVVSLALHNASNSTPHILLNSREAPTNKPQLIVTTTDTNNAAPTVSLTTPSTGSTFTTPANIPLDAIASDADGIIAKVDFYAGTSLIGTDSTSPYSIQWSAVDVGSYSLSAVATDNKGASGTSTVATVSVFPANNSPTVSLTSPISGLSFAAGSNISLSANAGDVDGTVSKVDFYAGATLIGTDTTAPYSIVWTNIPAGAHSLTAVATDNGNATATSNAVGVDMVWQTGLSPTADAYVRDGASATTNFGTALDLQTQVSSAGANREIYLKFDISTISGISTAKLRLFGGLIDASASNVPTAVYASSNTSWTESGTGSITWNTRPTVGAALSSVTIIDNNARWYEWDVTSYIQSEQIAGRTLVTLAIKTTATSNAYATFRSREADLTQPQLAILSTSPRNILFVLGASTPNTSEAALKTRMENLGFVVTVKAAGSNQNSAVKTTDAGGRAAVVISSTVTPANVLAKFRHVPIPVLLWESDLLDDQGMTEATAGFFGTEPNQGSLSIIDAAHPMAAGLTGTPPVVSANSSFTWGKPNANAVKVASLLSDAARIVIFGYETGALMPGLASGLPAPARRVAFFLTDTNGASLTQPEGTSLFDAAIKWLTATTVAPSISLINPVSGSAGTLITISGYNFGDAQGTSSVTFNGSNATISSWNNTSIGASVPAAATTGPVMVIVNGKVSNGVVFSVNLPPVDVDGDGLPDSWEIQYFGNLGQTALGDPDGDGLNNLQEFLHGRNPTAGFIEDINGGVNLQIFTPLFPIIP
jgi:Big-like domain-containing protein/beta-propeller repeat-containing protein/carboxypeptidase family protein/IPT/TIG domain-containing protein